MMQTIAAFVAGVGAVCGISTFLAVLMVVADATIANYGEVKISVNDEKEYVVQGGKPLLVALRDQQLFIPSACGGRGSCGLCKVKVHSGAGDILPTELPWLDDQERATSVRLACQLKVKQDFTIEIPAELFNVRQFETEVVSIKDLTYDIKEVTFRLIDPADIEFKAGQYVQIEVPGYELVDEPVYRAYSVASAPGSNRSVELEIRLVPDGICTTFVHKYLKEGDRVTLNGPYGDFFLRESDRDIIFIAGGSGMAPVKSILLNMIDKGVERKTQYFFGGKAMKDLFLLDEMKSCETKLPNFEFIPALSEPDPDDDWTGQTGLITEVVDRLVKRADEKEAYLCGSPNMIDACVEVLLQKGVTEDRIFYDKFA